MLCCCPKNYVNASLGLVKHHDPLQTDIMYPEDNTDLTMNWEYGCVVWHSTLATMRVHMHSDTLMGHVCHISHPSFDLALQEATVAH